MRAGTFPTGPTNTSSTVGGRSQGQSHLAVRLAGTLVTCWPCLSLLQGREKPRPPAPPRESCVRPASFSVPSGREFTATFFVGTTLFQPSSNFGRILTG